MGEITEKQQQLISILELLRVEEYIYTYYGSVGRPCNNRSAIARAFVTRAVYNMPTTRMLIERFKSDINIRQICGWERQCEVPEEWSFSRAFSEFSKSHLPERIQEDLISKLYKNILNSLGSVDFLLILLFNLNLYSSKLC